MSRRRKRIGVIIGWIACWASALAAAEPDRIPGMLPSAIGVTRAGTAIRSWIHPEDLDLQTGKTRVLLIGGLAGEPDSVAAVQRALHWFWTHSEAEPWRESYVVSAVPNANPEGVAQEKPDNGVGGDPSRGYPPAADGFYHTPKNPEAAYLWRWIGMHAPDLVVEVRGNASRDTAAGELQSPLANRLRGSVQPLLLPAAADELSGQLSAVAPSDTRTVPALKLAGAPDFLPQLLASLKEAGGLEPSPMRRTLQRRIERTPLQIAEQLGRHYGHQLPEVAYIPAVALIGRLRYGELARDERERRDVERIVEPYFRGDRVPKITQGNHQSGHLLFCELAERSTGEARQRYVQLARAAADLAFEENGEPREAMPFHLEMSDALFMGGPILAHVGKLTGEPRYFDACLRHLKFMRALCLRSDGIYRHSPLDETAWGRGNGFPALGLALCLDHIPEQHPGRAELLAWFREHLRALQKHQDPTGCWHQVVDRPESYRELTATCMIGFAMAHGIRQGWLDRDEYQPAAARAWYAVQTRVGEEGGLVDVCTGTGKQKSLRDYYDRPAILGRDDRGGAMALLFATEQGRRASDPR